MLFMIVVGKCLMVVEFVCEYGIDVSVVMCLFDWVEKCGLLLCVCSVEDRCVVWFEFIDEGCVFVEWLLLIFCSVFD